MSRRHQVKLVKIEIVRSQGGEPREPVKPVTFHFTILTTHFILPRLPYIYI